MVNEPVACIQVEVIYAGEQGIWKRSLELPLGSSAQQAVEASGVLDAHPELSNACLPPLGVYGRLCAPQQLLQAGDRVELYRPLVFDPMESRRRRQQHKARKAATTRASQVQTPGN